MRDLNKTQKMFWMAGLGAALLAAVFFIADRTAFFRAYLTAFIFWNGVASGCLGFLLLHQLTGGVWGETIRPYLQAGSRTIPFLALLFIPIALGLSEIYPWMHPHEAAHGHHAPLGGKEFYLTAPAVLIRAALYFLVLSILSWVVNNDVSKRKAGENAGPVIQFISGLGIFFYVVIVTFSSIDWMMSLAPDWFSSIFGLIAMIGQGISALTFCILWLSTSGKTVDQTKGLHDVGNLLLGFVMLWAYHCFSQFLIIWSGNLPEEIGWYAVRSQGVWKTVVIGLTFFHFVIPFFLLLMRQNKRKMAMLSKIAAFIFIVHFFDLVWTIVPSFSSLPALFPVYQGVLWLAIGGLWLGAVSKQLKKVQEAV